MGSSRPTLRKRIDDRPSISREMVREAEAIFHGHLKRVGLKLTGQRDAILRRFLDTRSEEHTSELQSLTNIVCRLLLEKNNEDIPLSTRTAQSVNSTCQRSPTGARRRPPGPLQADSPGDPTQGAWNCLSFFF